MTSETATGVGVIGRTGSGITGRVGSGITVLIGVGVTIGSGITGVGITGVGITGCGGLGGAGCGGLGGTGGVFSSSFVLVCVREGVTLWEMQGCCSRWALGVGQTRDVTLPHLKRERTLHQLELLLAQTLPGVADVR